MRSSISPLNIIKTRILFEHNTILIANTQRLFLVNLGSLVEIFVNAIKKIVTIPNIIVVFILNDKVIILTNTIY